MGNLFYLYTSGIAILVMTLAIELFVKSHTMLNHTGSLFLLNISFLIGSTSLKHFFISNGNINMALLSIYFQESFIILLGPTAYAVSKYFPRGFKSSNKDIHTGLLLFLSGSLAFLLFISNFEENIYRFFILSLPLIKMTLKNTIKLLSFVAVVYSALRIILRYYSADLISQKKQISYFAAGIIPPVTTALFFYLFTAPLLIPDWIISTVTYTGVLIFCFFLTYSIINYRFFSLRKKLSFILRDSLIGFFVSLPAVIFLLIFRNYLSRIHFILFIVVMTLLLIILFWLFQNSVGLAKMFLKINEDNQEITDIFFDHILFVRTINELGKRSVEMLTKYLESKNADFLYLNPAKKTFDVIYSANKKRYSVPVSDEFLKNLKIDEGAYERETIFIHPKYHQIRLTAKKYFQTYKTEIILPVYNQNELTGVIHIDKKYEEEVFSQHEIRTINKLQKVVNLALSQISLYEKEEKSKLTQKDLDLASGIQSSVFQKIIPQFTHLDAYALQSSAKEVSGDYFRVQKKNDKQAGVLIADVSGKGVPAALIAMMIHAIARTEQYSPLSPTAILRKINDLMASNQDSGISRIMSFATVFAAFFDNENKWLYYINAGHNPPFIFNLQTQSFDLIKTTDKPTGIFPDNKYETHKMPLESGQIFILYSDGITEAINSEDEEFGEERLKEIVSRYRYLNARKLSEKILFKVHEFSGSENQFDDETLIIIKT